MKEMMKKLRWAARLALIVMVLCGIFLFAPAENAWAAGSWCGVDDAAGLLTDSEEQKLTKTIEAYTAKYECEIAVVTTNDAQGQTAQAYADAYAERIGMSMTEEGYPGILFLIDMDNREIYIATQGKAIGWYSEKRIDRILDNCFNHVADGEYYDTCTAFLKGVRDYMGREPERGTRMGLFGVLVRLAVSLIVGAAITFAMVYKRGGRVTTNAATYFNAAQSHLDEKEDHFVRRTLTRRHIPKPQNKGGGHSGGGGGIHVSSGGGVHGGGGRKF